MNYSKDAGVFTGKVKISFRTENQSKMANCIRDYPITIVNGPAGTGKTVLTVALAIEALRSLRCDKIVISRPIVEAGEHLGFLPGAIKEKTDAYMRPIMEAFQFVQGVEEGAMKDFKIETVPLAYMRGRTFRNSFIILDEAQNATKSQLYLIMTRMDENSICVIVGDVEQVDIPNSGLKQLCTKAALRHYRHIAYAKLDESDMVRNPFLEEILDLFKD